MMKLNRDECGQLSLYDALIYFTILLVASTALFFYSFEMERDEDFTRTEEMSKITEETRLSIMRSTVPETTYVDKNGDEIQRENNNVESLIVEKLYLIDKGIESDNISYGEDIERLVDDLLRGRYEWALTAVYVREEESLIRMSLTDENLESGDQSEILEQIDGDIYTSSWDVDMIKGERGHVRMNFILSPVWQVGL